MNVVKIISFILFSVLIYRCDLPLSEIEYELEEREKEGQIVRGEEEGISKQKEGLLLFERIKQKKKYKKISLNHRINCYGVSSGFINIDSKPVVTICFSNESGSAIKALKLILYFVDEFGETKEKTPITIRTSNKKVLANGEKTDFIFLDKEIIHICLSISTDPFGFTDKINFKILEDVYTDSVFQEKVKNETIVVDDNSKKIRFTITAIVFEDGTTLKSD